jgi:Xaa-Pro aminopeptidase
MEFVGSNWGEFEPLELSRWPVADFTRARRDSIAERFAGNVICFEAGDPKVRSNDTDYRFRPDTNFVYFTGWGSQSIPGSKLVIDAREKTPSATLMLKLHRLMVF